MHIGFLSHFVLKETHPKNEQDPNWRSVISYPTHETLAELSQVISFFVDFVNKGFGVFQKLLILRDDIVIKVHNFEDVVRSIKVTPLLKNRVNNI